MAPHAIFALYHQEGRSGVTVAVAILLRLKGPMRDAVDVDRWTHEIDATLLPLLGANVASPMGIAISASERTARGIAEQLILDAAVACPARFGESQDARPVCTVADFSAPSGGITN